MTSKNERLSRQRDHDRVVNIVIKRIRVGNVFKHQPPAPDYNPSKITVDIAIRPLIDRPQLLDEGDTVVAEASGRLQVSVPVAASGSNALASVMRIGADETAPLREFYTREMRPFLERPTRAHPLADPIVAAASFGKLRPLVPAALAGAVLDLENLCEEERQLLRQERMHRLLHGWLLVHVPLSFALMALAVVHIVMALRF
jgi:hypothetical protein